MRMMLKVKMPTERGNQAIRDGSLARTMETFIERFKPESSYFIAEDGMRVAVFVFEMSDSTQLPSIAEPIFMALDAEIDVTPAMSVDDMKAGLEKAMKAMG